MMLYNEGSYSSASYCHLSDVEDMYAHHIIGIIELPVS